MREKLKNIFTINNLLIGIATMCILYFITISLDLLDVKHIILFPIYVFFCFGLGAIVNYIYKIYFKK
jgi:hypothetical protein